MQDTVRVPSTSAVPPVRPSVIFLGIFAVFAALTYWLATHNELGGAWVFGFVVVGWIVSLTLHEFAHAFVAYVGGDRSVADKGYLTLDPTKYTDLNLSLIMPVVFVLIGGIGLPGGAVWINQGAIKNPIMRTLVSLAGPASNILFGAACLIPIGIGLVTLDGNWSLTLALGFLGTLQIGAVILNMIPIPGFDGYGAIDPHLSPSARQAIAPLRQYGFMIVFAGLFFFAPAGQAFWDLVAAISNFLGGDAELGPGGDELFGAGLRGEGYRAFQFWN